MSEFDCRSMVLFRWHDNCLPDIGCVWNSSSRESWSSMRRFTARQPVLHYHPVFSHDTIIVVLGVNPVIESSQEIAQKTPPTIFDLMVFDSWWSPKTTNSSLAMRIAQHPFSRHFCSIFNDNFRGEITSAEATRPQNGNIASNFQKSDQNFCPKLWPKKCIYSDLSEQIHFLGHIFRKSNATFHFGVLSVSLMNLLPQKNKGIQNHISSSLVVESYSYASWEEIRPLWWMWSDGSLLSADNNAIQ